MRRAKPPEFSKSIRDVFFPDAREKLVGTRPEPASGKPTPGAATAATAAEPAAPAGGEWSKLIAAEAVEDEIKSQQIRLADMVANPTRFKSGEFRQARTSLSTLAAMLGVVAEYDGRVRWQDEAAALRDLVGQAAASCTEGTDDAYQQARMRSDDLQLLIRGGSLSLPAGAEQPDWSKLADRPSLMKRLEQAQQQVLSPLTANSEEFQNNAERLYHESQIVAALAELITREGFEFADDPAYVEFAKEMQQQALSVRNAARQDDYEQARQAAGDCASRAAVATMGTAARRVAVRRPPYGRGDQWNEFFHAAGLLSGAGLPGARLRNWQSAPACGAGARCWRCWAAWCESDAGQSSRPGPHRPVPYPRRNGPA